MLDGQNPLTIIDFGGTNAGPIVLPTPHASGRSNRVKNLLSTRRAQSSFSRNNVALQDAVKLDRALDPSELGSDRLQSRSKLFLQYNL